jgi:hypothetical protein
VAPAWGGAAVEILQLLDELEAEVNAARKMPLGSGVVIDRRRFQELIAQLRIAIPANIRQARGIIEQGDRAISDAEQTAARIVADAEREAEERLSQTAVTRAAQERAYQIEMEAQERARRTVAAAEAEAERRLAESTERARTQEMEADRYAIAVLHALEQRALAVLDGVREAKAQFRTE